MPFDNSAYRIGVAVLFRAVDNRISVLVGHDERCADAHIERAHHVGRVELAAFVSVSNTGSTSMAPKSTCASRWAGNTLV